MSLRTLIVKSESQFSILACFCMSSLNIFLLHTPTPQPINHRKVFSARWTKLMLGPFSLLYSPAASERGGRNSEAVRRAVQRKMEKETSGDCWHTPRVALIILSISICPCNALYLNVLLVQFQVAVAHIIQDLVRCERVGTRPVRFRFRAA